MDPTRLDLDRIRKNLRTAEVDDLLDRVTVFRGEMEPEAVPLIEAELWARGVTDEEVEAHARRYEGRVVLLPDGSPASCTICQRPAVAEGWGWEWYLSFLPIFPRYYYYCRWHCPHRANPV